MKRFATYRTYLGISFQQHFNRSFFPLFSSALIGLFMLAGLPSASADNTVPAYLNSDSKFSLVADLALVKTVNDNTPDPNQVITFTLVVSNAGPNPATSVTIRDVVPAGLTFVVGSQTGPGTYNSSNPPVTGVNWQNVFIANGGSVVLGFQATVTAAGGSVITNFAEVTSSVEVDPDSTPNNGNIGEDDGDTEMVTVNNPIPPVVLTCPVNTTTAACQTQAAVNSAFATWLATASGTGGCNGVLTNNNTGAPAACGGSTTVTFTYTSTCAPLTTTCQATFTVAAAPTPNLSLIVGTTIISACQTQAAVDASYATWLSNNVQASGGCNGVLTNNSTGAPSACGGSITVIWTYTTSCAAPITTQGTFTVNAAPPPSLTCPNPLIRPVCQTRAQDSIAMQNWVNTSSFSGGCNGSISYNGFNGSPPSSCGGTKTLTLTYSSSCAAPLTCTSTFTIPAPTAPVLTCPTNQTEPFGQTQAQINAAFATWLSTASGTGGCNGVLSNNNIGAPPATGGSTTVTFTYAQNPPSTPFSGACPFSTLTCQATFAVSATPPVVLTCPTNTTTAACQTQAAVNAAFATWLATASGTGGCNGVLTNNNTGAPPACGGSTTVTFTYTSTCAPLTTTCQATFTVAAPPPVTIICPVPTTVASCQSQAAINAQYAAWLATFNGQGGCNLTGSDNGNFPPSNCGEAKTVTFTLTSTCAPLTTSCQSTFTVTTPPPVVLTCPVNTTTASCQTQAAVNTAFATWLATASASGGCNGVLTNNNTGAPPACGGSTTVTFTYTSSCAPLTTTCQATFTVAAAPTVVLTCPVNTTTAACQTQAAVNTAFATWLATASASGGCNGVLTNNNTGAPSACGGSTTVTFTYTSACAPLTTTCQATFTVASSPVVLTCPTNTTAAACQTQAAINTAFATWLATASASGGCNGVLTNNNTGAPSACGGSTTVTFTYTSSCAPTTTTCQATFTVSAAPTVVLTCPTNTTAAACQTQATVNTAFATWLATASASGGCNGVLTNNNTGAPSACGGSTTVTFTYTSSCAPTTTTCQATFTVAAAPPVVLTCPTPTTASACLTQSQLDAAYNAWLASATASGGCNGVLTNNSPGAPSICSATAVVRTVVFTYTSSCAPTTTTCTSTFTVPAYPTFTVPANGASTVACPALIVQPTPPVVVDGCGKTLTPTGPVITNAPNPITCEGTRTFVWTYTDCAGHVLTWSHVTTVERQPFTVPANGAATVACPANATQPVPPTVTSNCGEVLTPTGPVITNNPNPLTCEGTRTYTWTYTDCEGNTATWSFVYTVERQPFGVPGNVNATVACPDDTDVVPTPPVVTSNCGEVLTPVISSTPKNSCEGERVYTFHYTDCEGNTADWQFIYHVEYLDFIIPSSETVSVECPLNASQPVPPVVYDNCSRLLNPTGPVITSTNNASGCEGSRTYAWTYKDCEGNTHVWSKTFVFLYTSDFFVYPDGEDFVGCLLYAQPPVPPTIYDNCGNEIIPTGPVVTGDSDGCSGTRKFTYTYKDCGGHSHNWNYTYHANDNEPPVGNCPSGSLFNVDVTNLNCIEEVPCPDNYDFSSKIAELLDAGNIYDLCSGDDIIVELDSWSELWECSDPEGDGTFTFGRTFYFRIADQCGNEMSSLCPVTYSGSCLPIQTFTQSDWGNEGGEPGSEAPNTPTDLQLITTLLNQGPLVIGGSHRSLTLTSAQCLMSLVPGAGGPTKLGNCHQVNCSPACNPAGTIGMKNSLATNTISLILNMRYNVQFNGLTMAQILGQGLGCVSIDPNIKVCSESGGCKLHLFESNGTEHVFPYTFGGLLDLANLFLDGNLTLTNGQSSLYANAINNAISNVNAYWNGLPPTITCDPNAGVAPFVGDTDTDKSAVKSSPKETVEFDLAPNPSSGEVVFSLPKLEESKPVTLEIYSAFGKPVFHKEYGNVSFVRDRIHLNNVGSGLYLVTVKAGGARSVQKFYISKD